MENLNQILNQATIDPNDIAYFEELKRKRRANITAKTFVYIFLAIWAFFAIFPICWVFINSFKPSSIIRVDAIGFRFESWSIANYQAIFGTNINVFNAYWNSIYTSVLCVILCLTVSVMMAFCLSRFKFPGHRILDVLVVACMMFPAFCLLMPLFRMYDSLNIMNTHFAYIMPQVALNMAFTTILLKGFFQSLPLEVEESAFLDGASVPRTLIQIVLPMMRSALVTCVIFIFLWTYNDLVIQNMVLRNVDKRMLPALMKYTASKAGKDYGATCAVGTMIAVPMLIVYFVLQKHIIKGLTAGAVKG